MSKTGFAGASNELADRVTIRLSDTQLDDLDSIVDAEEDDGHANRSTAIRSLLADALNEDTRTKYVVSNRSTSGKKRHKPASGTSIEPACRTEGQATGWQLKNARDTLFYDDCSRCFPTGGDA